LISFHVDLDCPLAIVQARGRPADPELGSIRRARLILVSHERRP